MRELITENGEKILLALGVGGPKKVSEKILTKYGEKKSSTLIWKILSNKVPENFKPSDSTYFLIGEAITDILSEYEDNIKNILNGLRAQ